MHRDLEHGFWSPAPWTGNPALPPTSKFFLCLLLFICRMGIIATTTAQGCVKIKRVDTFKVLSRVSGTWQLSKYKLERH